MNLWGLDTLYFLGQGLNDERHYDERHYDEPVMKNSLMTNACFTGHYDEWDIMTNFYNEHFNGILTALLCTLTALGHDLAPYTY